MADVGPEAEALALGDDLAAAQQQDARARRARLRVCEHLPDILKHHGKAPYRTISWAAPSPAEQRPRMAAPARPRRPTSDAGRARARGRASEAWRGRAG